VAAETMNPVNRVGLDFISELGDRISSITHHGSRETSFLLQRSLVQRFIANCFANHLSAAYIKDSANRLRHINSCFSTIPSTFHALRKEVQRQLKY
jgi:hypothetical protein